MNIRGAFKNYLAILSVKGVPPHPPTPPTPLTDNHFAKKPLADRGGTPPPPNGQFSKKMGQKGLKLAFLAKNSRF